MQQCEVGKPGNYQQRIGYERFRIHVAERWYRYRFHLSNSVASAFHDDALLMAKIKKKGLR